MITVPLRWMFRHPPPSAELHEAALVASEAQRLGIPWSGQPFEEVKAKVEALRGTAEVTSTILRDPLVELKSMPVDRRELRRVVHSDIDGLRTQAHQIVNDSDPVLVQDILELCDQAQEVLDQLSKLVEAPIAELEKSFP